MYLIFDTETTGLPKRWKAPITDTDNWPRCVQIAWQLHDLEGKLVSHESYLVKPEGFTIPFEAEQIHGISTNLALKEGAPLNLVLDKFKEALGQTTFIVGQNVDFDINIIGCEFYRGKISNTLQELPVLDTCTEITAQLCKIPGGKGGKFKLPTLTELHTFLFNAPFQEAHNATADVEATSRCFFELIRTGVFTEAELQQSAGYLAHFQSKNPKPIALVGLKHKNLKAASEALLVEDSSILESQPPLGKSEKADLQAYEAAAFAHLHNHTQFSILQSTIDIPALLQAAVQDNMPAVALTDTGNMMGAFKFINAIERHNQTLDADTTPLKGIVGCELNVCENHLDKTHKDNGYQIVFLAKNKRGYHNLSKLASIAYTEGFYYVPRVDKKCIETYKDDLIVLSGYMYGEIPSKILNTGDTQAEEALLWWKKTFGSDFYIELFKHGQDFESQLNNTLLKLARKHEVKVVATNATFYLSKEDAKTHDILLCVKDNTKLSTPIGRGRGYRYGLPRSEYYFKTQAEMKALFKDLPEAILNIQEILDKIENYSLKRDVLLPKFQIPSQFVNQEDALDGGKRGENAYLRHLTYQGAKERYTTLTPEIKERLDFELEVIANTGYPGYFLIVQDFIAEARKMGVSVGPGRGSAAGSAVAYCLKITNIDPIAYDLLFERFLNPDRVSMPDIDIDFDDEGRGKVLEYVVQKYGSTQVAQIITYGTMAAKSSIRDTARVLDLPLSEVNRITKMMPPISLQKLFTSEEYALKKTLRTEEYKQAIALRELAKGNSLEAQTLQQAQRMEGSLRNTGTHACGVIITPDDITQFVPIAAAKGADFNVTQFDNNVVEDAGLLKMDFLGLKTLTLIKDTVKIIEKTTGETLDPEGFPLDNEKTYALFQQGNTVGIFQYESAGMQKYLRELKPTEFNDLIAMNALYRPGPMDYIPSFVKRKHGLEPITYDLPEMQEYLEETYGITVYQEQVMLLSQKLAGFTKGEADKLRKAMGKKQRAVLDQLKPQFISQATAKGFDAEVLEKIWKDWEAFAEYAFNKSHATCYAWVAYQTAYLKANYPAAYMAAVLSNNMNDIKQVSFFMEECKRMGIEVLPPDVNESFYKFAVNKEGAIRFGMGAIKGVGRNAVETIVEHRKKNGKYKSVFDLAKRIDLRAANKKSFENLALAGGFDGFQAHRAQYLHMSEEGSTFLEKVLRYAARVQESENAAQVSLFGAASEVQIPEPEVPPCEPWGNMKTLKLEKDVVGVYISGHPLDAFSIEMSHFCNAPVAVSNELLPYINRELKMGGIVSEVQHRESKTGKGWALFTVEDFEDSYEFKIFGEEYLKYRHLLVVDNFIHLSILVREGWLDRDTGTRKEPRMQYKNIQLLHDILEKQTQKITLQLPVQDITNSQIQTLETLLKSHRGKKPLQITVYEAEEKLKIVLPSRKKKVEISKAFLKDLTAHQIAYKLN